MRWSLPLLQLCCVPVMGAIMIPRHGGRLITPRSLHGAHITRDSPMKRSSSVAALMKRGGGWGVKKAGQKVDDTKTVLQMKGEKAVNHVTSRWERLRGWIAASPFVSIRDIAKNLVTPLLIVAVKVLAFVSGRLPENLHEMDARRVLVNGEWHRFVTSLFIHRGPSDLRFTSIVITIFGAVCSRIFGPWSTIFMYIASGLFGNLMHLGIYLLGKKLSRKVFGLNTLRESIGRFLGDLGIPTSESTGTSIGATLGLVTAVWAVIVKDVGLQQDLRTLPWGTRAFVKGSYFVSGFLGAAMGIAVGLEMLFPKFGKAAPVGGALAGLILGSLLPYEMPAVVNRVVQERRAKRLWKAAKALIQYI